MSFVKRTWVAVMVLMTVTFALSCGEAPTIKVGVGETVITPPIGTPMAGYARPEVSKGVHDDLHARSLVIEDSRSKAVVMMTLSVINIREELFERIRAEVSEATGIPGDNILVSCTHTHSGPNVSAAGEEYQKLLVDNSVRSAVDAWNSRVPGRIGTGSTIELEVGRNDRRLDWGGLHPDPEVAIIKVEDARGNLMGVAFNYGCHPSTLDLHNFEFTEDWPYFAIEGIKNYVGEDVWVAYFQSAQGDVKVGYSAELSAVGAEMPIRNFWFAEHKGTEMSFTVLEALNEIATVGDLTVDAASDRFDFPLRDNYPITATEAERRDKAAKTTLAAMEAKSAELGKRVLDRYRVDVFLSGLTLGCARWVEANPNPAPVSMRMQAVRIGDSVFATFPNEVFSEIGLAVKTKSPIAKTYIIGVAGGHGGYIPTEAEYLEGGYTAVMTHFSPKCAQVCVNSALKLIGGVRQ